MLRKWWRRATESTVEFCERCGQVCTAACRSQAHLDRVRQRAAANYLPSVR